MRPLPHVARDVPALRRRPGPVPGGWGRVPPSLLRNSDEQTIAGTAAVFTAMEMMGLTERVRGLGRRGRVAIPGAGEPGRGVAELHGGGRVGHLAALDPAFCPPFRLGDDQPGSGAARAEPGSRRRAARRGRGLPGGLDLVVDRGRARRLAGPERLVPELVPDRAARHASRRRRVPGPGPGPGAAAGHPVASRPVFRVVVGERGAPRAGPDRPGSAGREPARAAEGRRPGRSRPIRAGGCGSSWSKEPDGPG